MIEKKETKERVSPYPNSWNDRNPERESSLSSHDRYPIDKPKLYDHKPKKQNTNRNQNNNHWHHWKTEFTIPNNKKRKPG